MIIDTSAIIAILLNEPEHDRFFDLIVRADGAWMSGGSWIELSAVIVRRKLPYAERDLRELLRVCAVAIAPVTAAQADIGHAAYRRYGRGTGHPARLNLGDCFAYALAKERGEPLLFKGDDFTHTDVLPAT